MVKRVNAEYYIGRQRPVSDNERFRIDFKYFVPLDLTVHHVWHSYIITVCEMAITWCVRFNDCKPYSCFVFWEHHLKVPCMLHSWRVARLIKRKNTPTLIMHLVWSTFEEKCCEEIRKKIFFIVYRYVFRQLQSMTCWAIFSQGAKIFIYRYHPLVLFDYTYSPKSYPFLNEYLHFPFVVRHFIWHFVCLCVYSDLS